MPCSWLPEGITHQWQIRQPCFYDRDHILTSIVSTLPGALSLKVTFFNTASNIAHCAVASSAFAPVAPARRAVMRPRLRTPWTPCVTAFADPPLLAVPSPLLRLRRALLSLMFSRGLCWSFATFRRNFSPCGLGASGRQHRFLQLGGVMAGPPDAAQDGALQPTSGGQGSLRAAPRLHPGSPQQVASGREGVAVDRPSSLHSPQAKKGVSH